MNFEDPPTLRAMQAADWEAVKGIYLEGIATKNATFQTCAPDWATWDKSHLPHCRLIAESNQSVLGWAMLSPLSNRCVYAGVAEVSVYVAKQAQGKGLGQKLLVQLINESETHGLWTLEAGIFPENIASVKLHKHCGFREVGRREKLGRLDGVWRDVLLLERRSPVVV